MSKSKNHGGVRKGAGRKPKADEIALIERLSPMDDLALAKLEEKVGEGDMKAIALFMNYRFGKPKETKDITVSQEIPIFGLNYDALAEDITPEEDGE